MSLNYDLTKIKDKTLCWEWREADPTRGPAGEYLKPITEHLIWATMGCEIGNINKTNVGEFWARLSILYALDYSTHMYGDGSPVRATMSEVIAHIGLSTNVGYVARKSWLTRADGFVRSGMTDLVQKVEAALVTT